MSVQDFMQDIGEKVKDIYYAGEEKWYKGLDRVDEHIPVYKIIDRVDEVVPSFALFLVLIFILILLLIISVFGSVTFAPEATLVLSVEDSTGKSVSDVFLEISPPADTAVTTNEFGMAEDVTAPLGSKVDVIATHGDTTANFSVEVSEEKTYETLVLPVEVISFSAVTARFVTETGALIDEDITLSFSCTNPNATPPSSKTIDNGTVNISTPSDCGVLSVTALSTGYEVDSYNLAQNSNTVYMNEREGAFSSVTVNLSSEGNPVQENMGVYAYRASNPYSTDYSTTSSEGQATLSLPAGDFIIKTNAEKGYASAQSEIVSVSDGQPTTVDLELEQTVLGLIKVKITEEGFPLEDIHVSIKKNNNEIKADESDANGEVLFEVEETGPFTILASDDDYCPVFASADIGDTVEIELEESDGTCGYTLKAEVFDSTGKPVRYAKVLIFGEDDEGIYKIGFEEKVTDWNGEVEWENIPASDDEYKVFAYKNAYSGWSDARVFDGTSQDEPFEVTLDIPFGNVNVVVKDRDGKPINFAEVQLFDSYQATPNGEPDAVTGIRLVEDTATGIISFTVRADKQVYAVVKNEGYETLTTMPKQVVADGTIVFEAELSKPPLEIVEIEYLGIFKDDARALSVESGKEYELRFAITAPLEYEELGYHVRIGSDQVTKTELDKAWIKQMSVPGIHSQTTGASYNPPTGYNIDAKYLNLEEAKWAQSIWQEGMFEPGKIIVGTTIKIKNTAQDGEKIDVAYRAWGVESGDYIRAPVDETLGTARSSSEIDELYAKTRKAWISVGDETLCEDKFCITSRYTDEDGFTQSFDTSFEAQNNENYDLYLKVLNASGDNIDSFYNAAVKLENKEENLDFGEYALITPNNSQSTGTITGSETGWLDTPNFTPNSEITFSSIAVQPEKEGTGTIKMRIRDGSSLIYEKEFSMYIAASKKFRLEFLKDGEFGDEMPDIPSGKEETLTVKVFNTANGLEVNESTVKLFDRFGTKLYEAKSNSVGTATLTIPASLPAEKLKVQVEKIGYETLEHEFEISEQVVNIDPASVSFTVNPQTKKEDSKTITVTNSTGLDLTVSDIEFSGKFYGLLSESQIESWFNSYEGMVIAANDYEEIVLKVVSADSIDTADDLEGVFTITLTSGTYSWTEDVTAKVRVGLGADVDDPSCLSITKSSWTTNTEGEQIETSFDITNDCTVDGTLVGLTNFGAKNNVEGNSVGQFTVQASDASSDISTAYYRTILNTVGAGETVPVTVRFTPYGGVNGTTTGSIMFKMVNETDSQDQEITTALDYSINIVNLEECLVIGSDLIEINEDSSSSFNIQNNCPDEVDISIDSDELGVSNESFSIASGGSEEVTVYRYEGDAPGAYNIVIYGRQSGTSQVLGNVKALLDPADDECITLSRYEFDVYDSTGSETDGFDTAYLQNRCLYQTSSVTVSGEEDIDMDSVWLAAALGAVSGFFTCNDGTMECLVGSTIAGWFDGTEPNVSKNIETANERMSGVIAGKTASYDTKVKSLVSPYEAKLTKAKTELDTAYNAAVAKNNANFAAAATALETTVTPSTAVTGNVTTASAASVEVEVNVLRFAESDPAATGADTPATKTTVKPATLTATVTKDNIQAEMTKAYEQITTTRNEFRATIQQAENDLNSAKTALTDSLSETLNEVNNELDNRKSARQTKVRMGAYTNEQLARDLDTDETYVEDKFKSDWDNARKEFNSSAESSFKSNIDGKKYTFKVPGIKKTDGTVLATGQNTEVSLVIGEPAKAEELTDDDVAVDAPGEETKNCGTIAPNTLKWNEIIASNNKCVSGASDTEMDCSSSDPAVCTWKCTKNSTTSTCSAMATNAILDEVSSGTDKENCENSGINNKYLATGECSTLKHEEYNIETNTIDEVDYVEVNSLNMTSGKCCTTPRGMQSNTLTEVIDGKTVIAESAYNVTDTTPPYTSSTGNTYDIRYSPEDKKYYAFNSSRKVAAESGDYGSLISAILALPDNKSEVVGDAAAAIASSPNSTFLNKLFGESGFYNSTENFEIQNDSPGSFKIKNLENSSIDAWKYDGSKWTLTIGSGATGTYDNDLNPVSGGFILASSADTTSMLTTGLTSIVTGSMGGSALGGALIAGLSQYLLESTSDRTIEYSDSGTAPLFSIDSIDLQDAAGNSISEVGVSVGDTTYDYGQTVVPSVVSTTSGWTNSYNESTGQTSAGGSSSSYYYSATSQTASQGIIEEKKLTFTNNGFVTDSQYNPLAAILNVAGTAYAYATEYEYDDVGGDFNADNLTVSESYTLDQQFHLLFNSWEYEDQEIDIDYGASCTVGQKTGSTGPEAVPRLKLEWDWADIAIDECDEDNDNYVYCDSTQFTISLLKKMDELKDFFQTTSLPDCPQAIDVAGTRTQEIEQNSIDIGITRIWMEALDDGARINATVQSNNQLEMDATVDFELEQDGSAVSVNCEETKTLISSMDYSCEVDSSTIGTGTFTVTANMDADLCTGCENNNTSNDSISTTLILGSSAVQECSEYSTKSNIFTNVLSANNVSTNESEEILGLVEFNTNLVQDGFSDDFKEDFDAYSMQLANAPTSYTSEGIRELFLSDKFELDWPQQPGAWKAGKYTVNLIVEFEEDSWEWNNDNNNIAKITVELEPWGNPDPYYALYDVAFDGTVGLDNERTGYGSNYEQMSEEALVINNSGVEATPNPSNNGVNNVEVSVEDSFYNINNLNRGNVLTVSRSGNDVKLKMSPSVAVPLILNVHNSGGRDAWAFYSVESGGQPQNTGSYLMSWSGIGGSCLDFHGASMLGWDDSFDLPASESPVGSMGADNAYGVAWENAIKRGRVSLYGVMFAPSGKSTIISIASSGDSADFESTMGSGSQITVNPSSGINSLKDVFDKVESEEICVIDGREYFWNTESYIDAIDPESKEAGCIEN